MDNPLLGPDARFTAPGGPDTFHREIHVKIYVKVQPEGQL